MTRLGLICSVVLASACFAPVGETSDGGTGGGQAGGSAGAGGSGGAGVGGGQAGGSAGGSSGGGFVDPCRDADNDGYVVGDGSTCSGKHGLDCDDTNAQIHPGAAEQCANGRDDDCDGLVDMQDPQCTQCTTGSVCSTAFDCHLGTTFCQQPVPGCCAVCPMSGGACAPGSYSAPNGIDPITGCNQTACIVDNGTVCPALYAPVCGVNGQTYGNSCELGRAGVTLLHPGECVPGENLDCRLGPAACGGSGTLYCRDACPTCDALIMRCTKIGVCVNDLDCPAGLAPPPAHCLDGGVPHATCVSSACQYVCP